MKPHGVAPARGIWLLQRKTTRPGAGLGKTSGWVHRATLVRHGVTMLAGVQYDRIDDAGLHITVGGESKLLEVDNVVICAGQESLAELMPPEGAARRAGVPPDRRRGAGGRAGCEAGDPRGGGAGRTLVIRRCAIFNSEEKVV